jgi:hypothetical protein
MPQLLYFTLMNAYTLEYKGQPVATITDAEYATPTFTGRCEFQDKEMQLQLIKAQEFSQWVEQTPDDLSDEAYEAEMANRGLQKEYDDMWSGAGWTVHNDKGEVSQVWLLNLDDTTIEWRQ